MVQMKRELGDSAVVLSSRTIQKDGVAYIEVTAGVDEQPPAHTARINPAVQKYVEQLVEQLRTQQRLSTPSPSPESTTAVEVEAGPGISFPPPLPLDPSSALFPLPPQLETLWNIFLADGYAPDVLRPIMQSLFADLLHDPAEQGTSRILNAILDRCLFADPGWLLNATAQRLFFIGPSGSGKSSFIAKLTAWLQRHHIGTTLLTTDTYKVDGSTLLDVTAELFKLPYAKFYTAQEMHQYLTETPPATPVVLIDTPGWNLADETQRRELLGFYEAAQPTATILVMPAYLPLSHTLTIWQYSQPFHPSYVAATKLDETFAFGSILSFLSKTRLPLAFASTGSEIPHDLRIASRELLFAYARQSLEHRMQNQMEQTDGTNA